MKLFEEFTPVTTEQWMDQVTKDLKGADYDKRLVTKTLDGLTIKPIYRKEDRPALLRPAKEGENNWLVREQIRQPDIAAANAHALRCLARGAEGQVVDPDAVERRHGADLRLELAAWVGQLGQAFLDVVLDPPRRLEQAAALVAQRSGNPAGRRGVGVEERNPLEPQEEAAPIGIEEDRAVDPTVAEVGQRGLPVRLLREPRPESRQQGRPPGEDHHLDHLLRLSDSRVRILNDPERAANSGPRDSRADISKIVSHPGWRPEIPWEQGLNDLWDEARQRPRLPLTA